MGATSRGMGGVAELKGPSWLTIVASWLIPISVSGGHSDSAAEGPDYGD